MRQLLLATALVAVPIGLFTGWQVLMHPAAPAAAAATASAASPLGDLSAVQAIVTDVQAIAQKGDLPGAKARIKDLETAWDDAQPTMQPKAPEAWGKLDGAIDDALHALRATPPDAAMVTQTLAALTTTLQNPAGDAVAQAAGGGVQMVSGIAVTDAAGHPLPCEVLLKQVAAGIAATPQAAGSPVLDLQAKALERCNADDDAHADAFSAQALAALKG